jgi:FemAB-related protein (PEP-CTERM system-associated)
MASCGKEVQGVLPLVAVKSWLFGRFLVSLPIFSYGGVLASTAQAREALLARAVEIAREMKARHVELRQGSPCDVGWHDLTPKVTMEVRLPASVNELWNSLSAKLRKRIRYARKHGLRSQWGGSEAVEDFYHVFSVNMRNLGTPVYPREWFENIHRHLPAGIRILTLLDEGRPVAGAFLTVFRSTLELPWAVSLPDSRVKFAPLLLYWSLLEYALEQGFAAVDLGRCTPGSGTHTFKRHWPCEQRPLHWYYWLAPGVPLAELRPDSPRFRLATAAWKRLPLLVANSLGPRVVRWFP